MLEGGVLFQNLWDGDVAASPCWPYTDIDKGYLRAGMIMLLYHIRPCFSIICALNNATWMAYFKVPSFNLDFRLPDVYCVQRQSLIYFKRMIWENQITCADLRTKSEKKKGPSKTWSNSTLVLSAFLPFRLAKVALVA